MHSSGRNGQTKSKEHYAYPGTPGKGHCAANWFVELKILATTVTRTERQTKNQ